MKTQHHRFLTAVATKVSSDITQVANSWIGSVHLFAVRSRASLAVLYLAELPDEYTNEGAPVWFTSQGSDSEIALLIRVHVNEVLKADSVIRDIEIDRNPPECQLFRAYSKWLESLESPSPIKPVKPRWHRRRVSPAPLNE